MHRPHESPRPRRGARIPFTVAASLALTAGLLCSTSAAHAAVAPTVPPTSPASATATGAQLTATARGELVLAPGETPKVGTEVKWIITVTNTGSVPLDHVAEWGEALPSDPLEPGQTREVTDSTSLLQEELREGYAVLSVFVPATTPGGRITTAPLYSRLYLPAPAPVEAPSLTATARGELDLTPGETPTVGTRVKWTVTVTNTGDVELYDVGVEGAEEDEVDLQPEQTSEQTLSTTIGQSELDDRAAVLTTFAGGFTEAVEYIGVDVTGRLDLPFPAPTPTPTEPTPPGPTPTAPPVMPGTPGTVVPAASATAGATGSTGSTAAGSSVSTTTSSSAAETSERRLADTGSDASGLLPAAGILAALGALGVLLGRRRRNRTAD